ncbi:hypothetical protein J6590_018741 [Homalodisca vitripennis]|nr:hypothetical protein J6590_018741 [Homalodisca vitripennis]
MSLLNSLILAMPENKLPKCLDVLGGYPFISIPGICIPLGMRSLLTGNPPLEHWYTVHKKVNDVGDANTRTLKSVHRIVCCVVGAKLLPSEQKYNVSGESAIRKSQESQITRHFPDGNLTIEKTTPDTHHSNKSSLNTIYQNMEGEIFQEVKEENFAKVLEVLKQDWPKHFMLYQTIKVFEEYKKAGTEWKHNLYVYGDLETGVYLQRISAEYPNRNINLLYVYTTNPDLTELKKGLMETTIIPWHTHEYMFEMTPNSELDVIQEVLTAKNVTCDARTNTLFIYPPEKDLKMNPLPEDVYVDKLDVSHAAEVNRNWPHRHTGSELMLTEHILRNFGIGSTPEFRRDLFWDLFSSQLTVIIT